MTKLARHLPHRIPPSFAPRDSLLLDVWLYGISLESVLELKNLEKRIDLVLRL